MTSQSSPHRKQSVPGAVGTAGPVSQTSTRLCWDSLPPGSPLTKQGPCTPLSHHYGHKTVERQTHRYDWHMRGHPAGRGGIQGTALSRRKGAGEGDPNVGKDGA